MTKTVSRQRAEEILNQKFKMKYVTFTYPGYPTVTDRVDRISIGTGVRDKDLILIFMKNGKQYSCSQESFKDCLKLIKPKHGTINAGSESS